MRGIAPVGYDLGDSEPVVYPAYITGNSSSGATTQPVNGYASRSHVVLGNPGAGTDRAIFEPKMLPASWRSVTVEAVCEAADATLGNFSITFNINSRALTPVSGVSVLNVAGSLISGVVPPTDSGGLRRSFVIVDTAPFVVTPGQLTTFYITRNHTDAGDTNTNNLHVYALIARRTS